MEMKGEKITAVYVMVREDEIGPEDHGSYDGPVQRQKDLLLGFLERQGEWHAAGEVEVYSRRRHLLQDLERNRIGRILVLDLDRLGSSREEVDALLFELDILGVQVMTVNPRDSA